MVAAKDEARIALRVARHLGPGEPDNFAIVASDSVLGIFQQATAGIATVLVGIVALSLLVGGIVIMNIMLMVVSERTREIGLRKALGAKARDIMSQVLTESITLSVMGGVVGVALGAGFARLLAAFTPLPAVIEPWSVAVGILVTAAVGLFFGWYPARRAARLAPIEALEARMTIALLKRLALVRETAEMALDTLWANKMRSALTILGVVIGITSIVSMTALIRGFDTSLRDSIRSLGPRTIFVQRFGAVSFSSGASFVDLIKRPGLTVEDGEAIKRLAPSVALVDTWLGTGGPPPRMERIFYGNDRTVPQVIMGASEAFVDVNFAKILLGRSMTQQEVERRRNVAVHRLRPVRGAVPGQGTRPGGQAGARRRHPLYGDRRDRQAAVARRVRAEPRRLRDRAVHGLPQAVRQRAHPWRSVRRRPGDDRRGAARGRRPRSGDARGRGDHAHPP